MSPLPAAPAEFLFFFNDTAPTEIYTLSLYDALPISARHHWAVEWHRRSGLRSGGERPLELYPPNHSADQFPILWDQRAGDQYHDGQRGNRARFCERRDRVGELRQLPYQLELPHQRAPAVFRLEPGSHGHAAAVAGFRRQPEPALHPHRLERTQDYQPAVPAAAYRDGLRRHPALHGFRGADRRREGETGNRDAGREAATRHPGAGGRGDTGPRGAGARQRSGLLGAPGPD